MKVNSTVILGYLILLVGCGLAGYRAGYMAVAGVESDAGLLVLGLVIALAGVGIVFYGVKARKRQG